MKNSFLWILICIICLSILMGMGRVIFNNSALMSNSLSDAIGTFKDEEYTLWEERQIKENPDYTNLAIFIDTDYATLELINLNNNETVKKYAIGIGKDETPSPIGSFKIIHKGKWGKSFGTRWMGLNVPWGIYQWEYFVCAYLT